MFSLEYTFFVGKYFVLFLSFLEVSKFKYVLGLEVTGSPPLFERVASEMFAVSIFNVALQAMPHIASAKRARFGRAWTFSSMAALLSSRFSLVGD